jgi:dethiobiotin synthetase
LPDQNDLIHIKKHRPYISINPSYYLYPAIHIYKCITKTFSPPASPLRATDISINPSDLALHKSHPLTSTIRVATKIAMKRIFVTGIGTGIGKTLVSAIITEYLQADYWKPIQSGDLDNTDTMTVRRLISNSESVLHEERFRLTQPLSPHASAEIDGIEMKLNDFTTPESAKQYLVIEGAGGLMVPINNTTTIADLIKFLDASVILVSKNYLGSINHTLLTIQELERREIPITGLVFNGECLPQTENFIINYSNLPVIFRLDNEATINKKTVQKYAARISKTKLFATNKPL